MLTPSFHVKVLKSTLEIFKEESTKTIEKVQMAIDRRTNVVNVSELAAEHSLATICEYVMGVKVEDLNGEHYQYRKNLLALLPMFPVRIVKQFLLNKFCYKVLGYEQKERQLLKPIQGFTRTIIEKRRKLFHERKEDILNKTS